MNYKESAVAGTTWVRAARATIQNPLGENGKCIGFEEETVFTTSSGALITQPLGHLYEPFIAAGDGANREESFALIHPETGAVLGSATYADVQVLLHSLYYHVAAKRDAAAQGGVA